MRKITFLMLMLLFAGVVSAQTYPLVTLQDINNVPDSLWATFGPSPLAGDTVRVQGMNMARPVVNGFGDRRPIIWTGARWGGYIQDPESKPFGGLNILQNDTVGAAQGTLYADLADTAVVCEFTGVVTTYFQGVELILITAPIPIPVTQISDAGKRPAPIELKMEDLWTAPGTTINYPIRKWAGMYVQFTADDTHQLITSDRVTGTGSASGNFKVNDGNGNFFWNYAQSTYFKSNANGIVSGYQPPADGSRLSYLRGILTVRNTAYWIVPLYPGDIGPTLTSPPTITNVKRDLGVVGLNQPVTISATVKGTTGYVTGVKIFYNANGVEDSLSMTRSGSDSTLYTGTIKGFSDSTFVGYYLKAYDNNALTVTSPANITNSRYSYFTLGHALTIQNIRYSPFGSGYSGYNGYVVTANGVVVADTSDIPGNHGSNPTRVYIQNGEGAWSGIMLGASGPNGTIITSLKRGDNITVTGYALMSAYGTRIDTISTLTVNSHNNPMPAPHALKTSDAGIATLGILAAEPYNGTLVTYNNITVDSANADGTSNFGECYVKDDGVTHTRVIWSDGNTTYCNDGTRATTVKKGDKFTSVTGILGYTHSYYKLCPRKNDDVVGYLSDVSKENDLRASAYTLNQNYPNPFNPSTTISYSIPTTGMVTLRVFNTLGQEVKTLVNQVQNNGNYKATFDASSLPSGIYFYSLTANNFAQVKKMLLIK